MSDHIVNVPSEAVLDYIRTIDGDEDNDALLQRVFNGIYTEWEKMFLVSNDRKLVDDIIHADEALKLSIRASLDEAMEAKELIIKEI